MIGLLRLASADLADQIRSLRNDTTLNLEASAYSTKAPGLNACVSGSREISALRSKHSRCKTVVQLHRQFNGEAHSVYSCHTNQGAPRGRSFSSLAPKCRHRPGLYVEHGDRDHIPRLHERGGRELEDASARVSALASVVPGILDGIKDGNGAIESDG